MSATKTKKATTETGAKKEFTLKEVFPMWKRAGKEGKQPYFTGKYNGADLRGFYNTKKANPKEPDIRIYKLDGNKKLEKDPILSLWANVTQNKRYLSGKLGDQRVVGFINLTANEENKRPYFTIYFSDDQGVKKEDPKPKYEEVDPMDELPF